MVKGGLRNAIVALGLAAVAGGMVGLSFASVPLYRLFCEVTGFGGTPKTAVAAIPGAAAETFIAVRFDANVHSGLPWWFRPERREIKVRLGEEALAHYVATNLSRSPTAGTAVFNVTPHKVGKYFAKIDCFCFSEQVLAAGEEVPMAVSFYVDPAMASDPTTKDVQAITLSYTFFRTDEERGGRPGRQATVETNPASAGAAGRPANDGGRSR